MDPVLLIVLALALLVAGAFFRTRVWGQVVIGAGALALICALLLLVQARV